MKSKIFLSLLVIVVSVSMMIGGTFAWFTSQASSPNNSIVMGTINAGITTSDGNAATSFFLDFTNDFVNPGEESLERVITIKNTGNLDAGIFRHFAISDENIAKALILTKYQIKDWSGTWNILDYKSAWDTDGDGEISLYDLANNHEGGMDGWNLIGMRPNETMEITLKFKLDGALATSAMMGQTFNARLDVIATQPNKDAIIQAFAPNTVPYGADVQLLANKFTTDLAATR